MREETGVNIEKKIWELASKCLNETSIECGPISGCGVMNISLYTKKSQVGVIQIPCSTYKLEDDPQAHGIKLDESYGLILGEVKVISFPNRPLTLGQDYRKKFEDDLQTLVRVEFEGTHC